MLAATFMELFTNLQGTTPSAEDQLHSYVSQLRSRGDAIHASGEKIVTLDNGFVTTELLANLEMKNNQSYNAPFALVSLQIQSRTITPPCFLAYFASCKRFADEVAPEIVAKYPVEVEEIGRGLADIATAVNQTRAVVRTLRKLIDLVCKKPHVFNPLYADFLQLCIKSQLYGVGLEFIKNREVLEITERANLFAEDYLEYFYFSGICFMSVKDYRSALEAFITCITTPASTLSQVVVSAIKKAKIISLLDRGEKFELPKYTPSVVVRFFHEDMTPYDQIVDKFFNDNINELVQILATSEQALQTDNNYGIAMQLTTAWKYHKVQNISKSFISLSLPAIAEILNLPQQQDQIERILFNMICQEKIIASIHPLTSVISFEEDAAYKQFFEKKKFSLSNDMEVSIDQIMQLSNLLRENQKEILTSTEYIQKVTSARSGTSIAGAGMWGVASTMEFS